MTLNELKGYFKKELSAIYAAEEIKSFTDLLIKHRLQLSRVAAALQVQRTIEQVDFDFFATALIQLKQEHPIQYILGETEFYGLTFKLNDQVLIPRQETEELVDWILKEITSINNVDQKINILDIGTGSGCIAISIAKNYTDITIEAIDISKSALKVAQQNAQINKVDISFSIQDVLDKSKHLGPSKEPQQYDLIVSNPPYVRELEKSTIKKNVLEHEPHIALFVTDQDPLQFYKIIAQKALRQLKKNGLLFFELNQYLGPETEALMYQIGFREVVLRKDLNGNFRMLKAIK